MLWLADDSSLHSHVGFPHTDSSSNSSSGSSRSSNTSVCTLRAHKSPLTKLARDIGDAFTDEGGVVIFSVKMVCV